MVLSTSCPLLSSLPAVTPVAGGDHLLPMILIGTVLVVTFVFIALEWVHKSLAALLGAIVATNLDMLLNRRPAPLLIVRQPVGAARERLGRIVIPLNLLGEGGAAALGWAFRIAVENTRLELIAVASRDFMEAARRGSGGRGGVEAMDDATLAGLAEPATAGLVSAAQQHASDLGMDCRVIVRAGAVVPSVLECADDQPCILLAGCPTDCSSTGYQQTHALIRGSSHPVLVVT